MPDNTAVAPVHSAPVWQFAPPQQAAPTAPHAPQIPAPVPGGLLQPSPVAQTLFGQQICPLPPQAVHIPTIPPPAP
jgi:hypothetical protein